MFSLSDDINILCGINKIHENNSGTKGNFIIFFFISKQPITTIFSRQFNITRETVCNMEDLFLNHINNKKFIACNSNRCEHEIKKLNYKIYVQVDVNAIKKNHRVRINIFIHTGKYFCCS